MNVMYIIVSKIYVKFIDRVDIVNSNDKCQAWQILASFRDRINISCRSNFFGPNDLKLPIYPLG